MAYRGEKPACLLVCSSHPKGVSAQSFIHAFTLTSSTFNIYLATPDGKTIDFVDVNEGNRQWLAEFKSKPISKPHLLENMDGTQFLALVIPSCPGALYDLASSPFMAAILKTFKAEKKLICAVGYGVAALFASTDKTWGLANYSLTAVRAPLYLSLLKRLFPRCPIFSWPVTYYTVCYIAT
jgi:hypothetical protein